MSLWDYVGQFKRQADGKRFQVRALNRMGNCYQVYGDGLRNVAECSSSEAAEAVAAALEAAGILYEIITVLK